MLLLGCKPTGRFTEQHDIFFGIADRLKDLKEDIVAYWPEAKGKIHVDAWREVKTVDGHSIQIETKSKEVKNEMQLFFINLGGYKRDEFDEFHYKMLIAAHDKGEAIQKAKQTAFYKHTQFDKATSHIDDKYGVDVDDVYEIDDILPEQLKEKYSIIIQPDSSAEDDEIHLGYFKLEKL
jgi:hypothetical protein